MYPRKVHCLLFACLPLLALTFGCSSALTPAAETTSQAASPANPEEAKATPPTPAAEKAPEPTLKQRIAVKGCEGGVIKDDLYGDGSYGFVPSATQGSYVQEYHSDEFPSRQLEAVCVGFARIRGDDDANFEVVIYGDAGGRPATEPLAVVPGRIDDLPRRLLHQKELAAVKITDVTLPEGKFYIGARWSPTDEPSLYIAADQSPGTPRVNTFFRDDRSKAWKRLADSADPNFIPHRALLVRAKAAKPEMQEDEQKD